MRFKLERERAKEKRNDKHRHPDKPHDSTRSLVSSLSFSFESEYQLRLFRILSADRLVKRSEARNKLCAASRKSSVLDESCLSAEVAVGLCGSGTRIAGITT